MKKIIILFLISSSSALAGNEQEAVTKAAEAWAKYTGIDQRLERIVRDRIPKEYEPTLGYIGSVTAAMIDRKVVFKWEW